VDDDVRAYRLSTLFLVIGATLYYGPLVFAVEATSQGYLSGFGQAFTSNTNPTVALVLMWISLAGVALVAAWLFVRALPSANRSMARRLQKEQGASGVISGATGGGELLVRPGRSTSRETGRPRQSPCFMVCHLRRIQVRLPAQRAAAGRRNTPFSLALY
jgi:hypothetical protein